MPQDRGLPKSAVRLCAILARTARAGVVFRRGPSQRALLALRRTDADEFVDGESAPPPDARLLIDLTDRAFRLLKPPEAAGPKFILTKSSLHGKVSVSLRGRRGRVWETGHLTKGLA